MFYAQDERGWENGMKALGRHLMVELYGCDENLLNDAEGLKQMMLSAARRAKATIVGASFHTFNPHGISGFVVIAESHLAIHTWPEYGFASLDIFTCGDEVNPWEVYSNLVESFKAENTSLFEMRRGFPNGPPQELVE